MTLHLIKLCVGVDTVADLAHWQSRRVARLRAAGEEPALFHRTRQMPRRAADLLDGGSIYWVIAGLVLVRQRLRDLRPVAGEDGVRRCHLILDSTLVATRPQPRRAFQGWRYLEPADAPPDLSVDDGACPDMPADMRTALIELGLL